MKRIEEMQELVGQVIAVDDFTPEELPRYFSNYVPNAHNGLTRTPTPQEAAE